MQTLLNLATPGSASGQCSFCYGADADRARLRSHFVCSAWPGSVAPASVNSRRYRQPCSLQRRPISEGQRPDLQTWKRNLDRHNGLAVPPSDGGIVAQDCSGRRAFTSARAVSEECHAWGSRDIDPTAWKSLWPSPAVARSKGRRNSRQSWSQPGPKLSRKATRRLLGLLSHGPQHRAAPACP